MRDCPDPANTFDLLFCLAYFGPGLLKIGLTAADRGSNRLAEQGALAYTWLGRGPLLSVRRAEITAAATGIVRECRITRRAKNTAWWQLQDEPDRQAQLTASYQQLTAETRWPERLALEPFQAHDLSSTYGLEGRPSADIREVTAIDAGAVLAATVNTLVGRDALLRLHCHPDDQLSGSPGSMAGAETAGLVLMNLQLLSGWILLPCAADAGTGGPIVTGPGPGLLRGGDDAQAADVLF